MKRLTVFPAAIRYSKTFDLPRLAPGQWRSTWPCRTAVFGIVLLRDHAVCVEESSFRASLRGGDQLSVGEGLVGGGVESEGTRSSEPFALTLRMIGPGRIPQR
jgi:hypothetical protein